MVTTVHLPKLGEIMKEALVVEWLKQEGDHVRMGEPLVTVGTEKFTVDVEATVDGKILRIYAQRGESIPVGGALLALGAEGEIAPEIRKDRPDSLEAHPPPAGPSSTEPALTRVRATPAARKLAREHGIDLQTVEPQQGSAITTQDVFRQVEAGKVPAYDLLPLSKIRRIIGERLSKMAKEALPVTIYMEMDMSRAYEIKTKAAGASLTDIIVSAAARALARHRVFNSTFEEGQIRLQREINIGIAAEIEVGLVVPVVRGANKLTIIEIAKLTSQLVQRAREGALLPYETEGGTFTVSNLGMFGVKFFTPLINPPQTAILGVGEAAESVFLEGGGTLKTRPRLTLSLTFDHRVADGAQAARFLKEIKTILEEEIE
jgi:pyruvate dehydrogenase E2 component (dihydrolipoamide acetyltransferase)